MRANIVSRLLSKNISIPQIVGYAVANLVGLAIVLIGIQFYNDARALINGRGEDGLRDYLVVSKTVNHVSYNHVSFSAEEIAHLQQQPWVASIGAFESAGFSVMASVDFSGQSMSTLMFLESVPDEYLDVELSSWQWDEQERIIPIIISKDYLALYNYGFASSMGMPQLSEGIISSIPITLTLSGNGRCDDYEAYIVGYSSRLNTLLVPYDFLQWANARYATPRVAQEEPSRLIIKTTTPGDPAINDYLTEHGYVVAGDKVDNSRLSYILSIITAVVVGVGAVISALALFILLLSVYLLIEKNKEKLRDLMLLGYTPQQVSRQYCLLVVLINAAVLFMAIAIVLWVSSLWRAMLASMGVAVAGYGVMLALAVVIVVAITIINIVVIRRRCRAIFC